MMDFIVIAVATAIVGLACYYIYREKKRGKTCIGCPYGGQCSARNNGCNGSCNSNITSM